MLRTSTILPNIRISWGIHPTFILIFGRVIKSYNHSCASTSWLMTFDPGILEYVYHEKDEKGGKKMEELIMKKRLYKSNDNKMIDGVCGGIAEYFNIDPTLIRLGWVIFCAMGGSGFVAYILAALIIPRRPVE